MTGIRRGLGQLDGVASDLDLAHAGLVDLHQHIPLQDTGVLAGLVHRAQRTAGDGLLLHHLHGLGHSVVGEELLQDGLQLHVIFRPVGVGVKLWILDQIGLADDLAQLGEVVGAGHGNDDMGVLAHVNVEGGAQGVAGTHAGGMDAADGVTDDVRLNESKHAVQHGDVHILALAGALPVIQRQQDACHRIEAGTDVAQRAAHTGGRGIGVAGNAHHAGHSLRHNIVGRQIPHGAVLSKAGNRTVDDLRIDLFQLLIRVTQLFHNSGLEVLHHDVTVFDHLVDDVPALLQVDRDAFLAAVHQGIISALSVDKRAKDPAAITCSRLLDLNDFGAEIRQVHGTEGPGQNLGKVQNPDPTQGFVHIGNTSFKSKFTQTV